MAASNTRFTQSSLVNQKIPLTVITVSTATPRHYHVEGARKPNHFLTRAWSRAACARKLSLQALRQKRRPQ
jgi:hypothetical protein